MRHERPIIGVTGPDEGGAAAWMFTRLAVWRAGGRALRITPSRPDDGETIAGLIIGGGADVDPTLYGQEFLHITSAKRRDEPLVRWLAGLIVLPIAWLVRKLSARKTRYVPVSSGDASAAETRYVPVSRHPVSVETRGRDAMETKLIETAVRRRVPVLGICRGAQLLNVFFGGSLHQDIRSFYVEDRQVRTILPRRIIVMPAGTKLSRILGGGRARVNALHHQAIDRLGGGIRIAARDRNGIIQAIEHESLPLVIGVQWHPEYLPQLPRQRALFNALVELAASRVTARVQHEELVTV